MFSKFSSFISPELYSPIFVRSNAIGPDWSLLSLSCYILSRQFTGDPEASFTKEEMQQGKHQEFEKKLHEQLINNTQQQVQQLQQNR